MIRLELEHQHSTRLVFVFVFLPKPCITFPCVCTYVAYRRYDYVLYFGGYLQSNARIVIEISSRWCFVIFGCVDGLRVMLIVNDWEQAAGSWDRGRHTCTWCSFQTFSFFFVSLWMVRSRVARKLVKIVSFFKINRIASYIIWSKKYKIFFCSFVTREG